MGYRYRAGEAIEILVVLAGHRELGIEAEQTLGRWNEQSLVEVASDPATPPEVLRYMLKLHGQRPAVVEALCDNPALSLEELEVAASHAEGELLRAMLRSQRVRNSSRLMELIRANPAAEPARPQLEQLVAKAQGKEAEDAAQRFLTEHAEEVACGDQPFELVSVGEGEDDPLDKLLSRAKKGDATAAEPEGVKQLSLLQRIGAMRVGDRIKLAMRGNREERMVLIRDRSKLVSLAVLESPKVNDTRDGNLRGDEEYSRDRAAGHFHQAELHQELWSCAGPGEQSKGADGCCAATVGASAGEGSAGADDE